MKKVAIPPIKSQGIKSKLVPWIKEILPSQDGAWIEPFMGTGVVGFNLAQNSAIMGDTNPHLINFYSRLHSGEINAAMIGRFLREEGGKISDYGQDYYYEVRKRFNQYKSPLDFLFLNRAGFNGQPFDIWCQDIAYHQPYSERHNINMHNATSLYKIKATHNFFIVKGPRASVLFVSRLLSVRLCPF